MLVEARAIPCDGTGCGLFRQIYERTIAELGRLLPDELRSELANLATVFVGPAPTPSEIGVAQAELVGWLEGLLNGIAAAAHATESLREEELVAVAEMPGQYL